MCPALPTVSKEHVNLDVALCVLCTRRIIRVAWSRDLYTKRNISSKGDTEKTDGSGHDDASEVLGQTTALLLSESPVTVKGATGLPGQSLLK